ncbi:molecular chaperone DnaK [Nocardiopsis sp. Huas11]|uniref:Hsp70 family protein n=1 Tax=Nocardiopsis sp. Huas11 TaxID=2183912 RepID=UPI000EAFA087|nr:Hsp70 family protein [Nocardiopsis sp. Huas11]RKS04470.1 molecular chaperone DnaK [Nocardiopsis sp. Huas11]
MSRQNGPIVGIDLGTTNTVVAVMDETGRPEVLRNSDGTNTTPSVVYLSGGEAVVGTPARHQRLVSDTDVVERIKPHMGESGWQQLTSDGQRYTAEQLSAFIVRKVCEDAALVLGKPVEAAVITVPAYFDEARRQATRDAGRIAGLKVERIISEPTAAALAYGLRDGDAGNVLVYDLGGGTFDVTVLRISDGDFDVIATAGDAQLGGADFDDRLETWANTRIVKQGGTDVDDSTDPGARGRLREQCENAKHRLSTAENASVFTEVGELKITRAEFDELIDDLLQRTRTLTQDALRTAEAKAGITAAALDEVLLVGGSTRIPAVKDLVADITGVSPNQRLHPDEAVALGAAVQAELIEADQSDRPSAVGDRTISDVTAHGLGVVSLDTVTNRDVNSVIIPAGSKVPAQHDQVFYTVVEDQEIVMLKVTVGDDTDPDLVDIITKDLRGVELTMPPAPFPKESPLRVTISYDIDAIVHVEVTNERTGRSLGDIEIERANNLSGAEVDALTTDMEGRIVR